MLGGKRSLASMMTVGLLVLASMGAMDATVGKPQPPPVNEEKYGTLELSSDPQIVMSVSTSTGQMVRLYNIEDGKLVHVWSANMGATWQASAIGDLDNDGSKEVVGFASIRTQVSKKVYSTSYVTSIWEDGDDSDSPSATYNPGFGAGTVGYQITDPDNDGKNELVKSGSSSPRFWSYDSSGFTSECVLADVGTGTWTVADADNDETNELLIGDGDTWDGVGLQRHGLVLEHTDDGYTLAGDLGPDGVSYAIVHLSVGDLNGDGGNEIFGSGSGDGTVFIWKYDADEKAYKEIWKETFDEDDHYESLIADVNGDGKNEIAFTTLYAGGLIVLKYDGDNEWSELGEYSGSCGGRYGTAVGYDVDSDDDTELLIEGMLWDWDGSDMKATRICNAMTASMA